LNNQDILKIEGLHKSFGSVRAVDGVDLRVGERSLTSIIGPNGAGKTSLFNLITGYHHPDSGRVIFHDQKISGLPTQKIARLGISRSFQVTNIFQTLTTFENVQIAHISYLRKNLNLFSRFQPLGREAVSAILKTVGLEGKARVSAGSLSHGDQRALEIGIALAAKPKLLLLDEPTAGMSSWETLKVTALMKGIVQERGVTVLFVEHDMQVAFGIADKVVVMHQGKVLVEGDPGEVRKNPEVRRVYLGEET